MSDTETGRRGDGETGGQGDTRTRGRGDAEKDSPLPLGETPNSSPLPLGEGQGEGSLITHHSSLKARWSAPSTQHSALGTQNPELRTQNRLFRRRLPWLTAATVLLLDVLAYLTGVVGDRSSQGPGEPVVEGPPPVVSASGPVVPEKRARLSFTASGRVKRLAVQPGDKVKQGQLLAQLEPSTVQTGAMASGFSPSSLASSDLYIMAPFDGVVGLVPVNEWETVTAGTPVVMLGDLSAMRVEIEDLSETDVGRLQEGQAAEISFEAFPGRKVAGQVTRISPMNNAKGGGVNYDVVVEFADRDLPPLRWGMTAHVDILVRQER